MIVSMGGSVSEPVKQPEYDPEDLAAIKLAMEQKKAAEVIAQTQSIHTRNREVWKATNRDVLEKHLIDEGLPFMKESVDAAHAKYVAELQQADELKAKEEKAKADAVEAARKAAETAAKTPQSTPAATENPVENPAKPLDAETQRMLAILPRLAEVITDMWHNSVVGQGWQFISRTTENKYGVRLAKLAQEVYAAYTSSKGSEEGLQALLKLRVPPQSTPTSTTTTTPITPQGPKSSTNQTQLPNGVLNEVVNGVVKGVVVGDTGVVKEVVQEVPVEVFNILDIVQRNLKLTTEQAISLRSEYGTRRG
jgi:hypothetical protein